MDLLVAHVLLVTVRQLEGLWNLEFLVVSNAPCNRPRDRVLVDPAIPAPPDHEDLEPLRSLKTSCPERCSQPAAGLVRRCFAESIHQ